MSDQHPPIIFVETEGWEEGYLRALCGHDCDIRMFTERVERVDGDRLRELGPVQILSTFIHSDCSGEQLQRFPQLRLIATRSTGFDHIDLDYCREHHIVVSNVPTYGENTVAEHAFALILTLTRKIHRTYERTVRGDFSLEGLRGRDLEGKTFGCVGTGRIGQNALRIARGFNMRALAFDVRPNPAAAARIGFEYVELDALLRQSYVVSLHAPYNKSTHHMIDADALNKMPQGAILINTARGGLVDPQALLESLRSGHLGGAGLDVLEGEVAVHEEAEILSQAYDTDTLRAVVRNHALLRMPNVIITPHVGFNSEEAVRRILSTTMDNIHAFLAGRPQNVVTA